MPILTAKNTFTLVTYLETLDEDGDYAADLGTHSDRFATDGDEDVEVKLEDYSRIFFDGGPHVEVTDEIPDDDGNIWIKIGNDWRNSHPDIDKDCILLPDHREKIGSDQDTTFFYVFFTPDLSCHHWVVLQQVGWLFHCEKMKNPPFCRATLNLNQDSEVSLNG